MVIQVATSGTLDSQLDFSVEAASISSYDKVQYIELYCY